MARWLKVLQEYDFEVQHRAGRLQSNADALSRRPCAVLECRYCLRHEERVHESLMVAALQTTEADQTIGEAEGWLLLTASQLEQQQQADDPGVGEGLAGGGAAPQLAGGVSTRA